MTTNYDAMLVQMADLIAATAAALVRAQAMADTLYSAGPPDDDDDPDRRGWKAMQALSDDLGNLAEQVATVIPPGVSEFIESSRRLANRVPRG